MGQELVPVMQGTEREYLARIEGKIDVLNERNSRAADDIKELRVAKHDHANQIAALQAANAQRAGEQQGFDKAVRAIYALATVCGLGSLAAIIKILSPGGL